jgi:membrane protein required for beta-lactamase induction
MEFHFVGVHILIFGIILILHLIKGIHMKMFHLFLIINTIYTYSIHAREVEIHDLSPAIYEIFKLFLLP